MIGVSDGRKHCCSDKCAICMSEFEQGQRVCATACAHYFHQHCLTEWEGQKNNCPVCRAKLRWYDAPWWRARKLRLCVFIYCLFFTLFSAGICYNIRTTYPEPELITQTFDLNDSTFFRSLFIFESSCRFSSGVKVGYGRYMLDDHTMIVSCKPALNQNGKIPYAYTNSFTCLMVACGLCVFVGVFSIGLTGSRLFE